MTENFPKPATWRSITLEARHVDSPRETLRRLVLAADAERRALERELHDGVQQQLVALAVHLQLARDDPARLQEAAADVEQALEEAARLAQRIYPALLGPSGLAAVLRAAAAAGGVRASVRGRGVRGVPARDDTDRLLLLARGARGCCRRRSATIVVRDEGEALVFDIVAGGGAETSCEGLRDRVDALGGRLEIRPEGGGVRVSGSLPLAR